jgi:hypothetical protein
MICIGEYCFINRSFYHPNTWEVLGYKNLENDGQIEKLKKNISLQSGFWL